MRLAWCLGAMLCPPMRRQALNVRWELVLFAAFAVVFSPGWQNDRPAPQADDHLQDLQARVLASTAPDALIATPPKLLRPEFRLGDHRPRPAAVPVAVAMALLGVPVLWLRGNIPLTSARRPSLRVLLVLNPRAPPALFSVSA
jgi:hypothetical protein